MKKSILFATCMIVCLPAVLAAEIRNAATSEDEAGKDTLVLITTPMGEVRVRLYRETPLHRANFLKLAGEGFYDGTLFHRVIKDFMIQGGDPQSKEAPAGKMLGEGDAGYTLPAEFRFPHYFHRRGVLAAAREGDQVNPLQASSGCQFYFVWGEVRTDEVLDQCQQRIRTQQGHAVFNRLQAEHRDRIEQLFATGERRALLSLQDSLLLQTRAICEADPFTFPEEVREVYKRVGGTPHLDGQYTVFGEIVSGLEVVDKIQQAATDEHDRPLQNIPMQMKLVVE